MDPKSKLVTTAIGIFLFIIAGIMLMRNPAPPKQEIKPTPTPKTQSEDAQIPLSETFEPPLSEKIEPPLSETIDPYPLSETFDPYIEPESTFPILCDLDLTQKWYNEKNKSILTIVPISTGYRINITTIKEDQNDSPYTIEYIQYDGVYNPDTNNFIGYYGINDDKSRQDERIVLIINDDNSIRVEGETINTFKPFEQEPKFFIGKNESEIFSQEEIGQAIKTIKEEFDTYFTNCEMHYLQYVGDQNNQENLDFVKSINPETNYTKAIQFVSGFHTPIEDIGTFDEDIEYKDYNWWLGKTDSGNWELVFWGYK